MTRGKLILRRWCDVVALSLVGTAAAGLALALGASWLEPFWAVSFWLIGAGAILVVAFVGHQLQEAERWRAESLSVTCRQERSLLRRLGSYLGLRHFLSYPPFWVAGVLGVGLLTLGLALNSDLRHELGLTIEFATPLMRIAETCRRGRDDCRRTDVTDGVVPRKVITSEVGIRRG